MLGPLENDTKVIQDHSSPSLRSQAARLTQEPCEVKKNSLRCRPTHLTEYSIQTLTLGRSKRTAIRVGRGVLHCVSAIHLLPIDYIVPFIPFVLSAQGHGSIRRIDLRGPVKNRMRTVAMNSAIFNPKILKFLLCNNGEPNKQRS